MTTYRLTHNHLILHVGPLLECVQHLAAKKLTLAAALTGGYRISKSKTHTYTQYNLVLDVGRYGVQKVTKTKEIVFSCVSCKEAEQKRDQLNSNLHQ